jgi:hypothetical protein
VLFAKDRDEVLLGYLSMSGGGRKRHHTLPEKKLLGVSAINRSSCGSDVPSEPQCRLLPRDQADIHSVRGCGTLPRSTGRHGCDTLQGRSRLATFKLGHLVAQSSNRCLQPVNAKRTLILMPERVMVLAGCIVPLASLTRALAIASNLGCSAIDACIDGAAFARSLGRG